MRYKDFYEHVQKYITLTYLFNRMFKNLWRHGQ